MEKSTYTLKDAREIQEKNRRFLLDEVHFAFREYMDGKISFAPIYGTSPAKILELGCGSGAWAIDAANDFPDAEIIAIDLSQTLEGIPLPKNVNFQIADVTQPFPFKQGSFDVVHTRLVLMHVPNAKDVLERAAKLVKPGGWLLVEDLDMHSLVESGGPGVSQVITRYIELLQARGADAEIGRKLESMFKSTGSFSTIQAQRVAVPVCDDGSAPQPMARLGAALKPVGKKLTAGWTQRFSDQGITQELEKQFSEELDTNFREVMLDMHFVWAQRV
ncbi:S-adenosyl-L-methionine-dependent methyltransferase [Mycena olivaceomarginata]|nr:S-adenosyl-L-methionine-dependent methyltransferase [Mycena olivaceomarginata]